MEKCREAREEHFHHRTCLADDEHVDTFKGKHRLQVMLFDVFWVSAHQLDMDVKSMVVAMNCCEYSGPILRLCSETRSETSSAPSSCFSVGQAHWGSKVQKLAKQSISAVTLKSHCCCDGLTFSGACKSCKSHCSLVLLSGGRLVLCLVRQWHCGMSSMKYNMSIYKLSICIYIYQYCVWYVYDICEYRLMKIVAVLAQPLKTYRLCPQQRSAAWCLCEAATGRMLVKAVPEGCSHWPFSAERANFCAINRCWNLAAYIQYIYIHIYIILYSLYIHICIYTCLNDGVKIFFQY